MPSLPLLLSLLATAPADEGMWLPEQIPQVAPRYPDLQVDPQVLADPTGAVLGSVVSLGGCTGSFVSDTGLIITNHHCVESYLQAISDEEHNHWRDGFVAPDLADERSTGAAGRVWITVSMEDVTDPMQQGIRPRTPDARRADILEDNEKALLAACEDRGDDRRCQIAPLDGGARFLLVERREIKDLRVVWAPPRSVGQYGGEIDNWEWPRHSFDAALLRAYVGPDGSSVPFAEDNVPYTPEHHLTVSDGLSEGDLVMVSGYPGSTARHRLASELAYDIEQSWQRLVDLVDRWTPILEGHAQTSNDASARLGPLLSGLSNARKNRVGVLQGVARSRGLERMQTAEADLLGWLRADRRRARTWQPVYDELSEALAESRRIAEEERYVSRLRWAANLLGVAHTSVRWATEQTKPDAQREAGLQDRDREVIERQFDRLERSLYLPAERDLVADLLSQYAEAPAHQRLPSLDAWLDRFEDIEAAVASLYDGTPALAQADARRALLDTSLVDLRRSDDPFVQLAVALEADLAPRRKAQDALGARLQRLRAAWADAEIAYAAGTGALRAPDANGTLRVTLGRVGGYHPEDGLLALPFTTLRGFAAKHGPEPFDAPEPLIQAAKEGPSSPWAVESLGDVPVDLLADLDTTGGNSGSPALDAQGRLAGLLFDGVWESVANDYVYDPDVNRSILADIRAIGWLLSHTQGARRVAEEMGLTR